MRLRLARRASRDLEAIYLAGCERFGIDQADRCLDKFWRKLDFIAEHPRAARERMEFDPPVRASRYGAHLVVYRIEEEEILVVRIPHGREDWQSGL